jgi:hypothetical protein
MFYEEDGYEADQSGILPWLGYFLYYEWTLEKAEIPFALVPETDPNASIYVDELHFGAALHAVCHIVSGKTYI